MKILCKAAVLFLITAGISCHAQESYKIQDYAFVKHAEGNWLSNIEEPAPVGSLRARQLPWLIIKSITHKWKEESSLKQQEEPLH